MNFRSQCMFFLFIYFMLLLNFRFFSVFNAFQAAMGLHSLYSSNPFKGARLHLCGLVGSNWTCFPPWCDSFGQIWTDLVRFGFGPKRVQQDLFEKLGYVQSPVNFEAVRLWYERDPNYFWTNGCCEKIMTYKARLIPRIKVLKDRMSLCVLDMQTHFCCSSLHNVN